MNVYFKGMEYNKLIKPAITKLVPIKESIMMLNFEFISPKPRETTLYTQVAMHSINAPNITGTLKMENS